MNNYHRNKKLTIEINLSRFLDTRMGIKEDGHYDTEAFRKKTKLPIYWSSKAPKRYKSNSLKGGLHPRKLQQIFKKKLH